MNQILDIIMETMKEQEYFIQLKFLLQNKISG